MIVLHITIPKSEHLSDEGKGHNIVVARKQLQPQPGRRSMGKQKVADEQPSIASALVDTVMKQMMMSK